MTTLRFNSCHPRSAAEASRSVLRASAHSRALALVLLLAGGAAEAVSLVPANFAPRTVAAGVEESVRISVGRAGQALGYGQFGKAVTIEGGTFEARAHDESGNPLATRTFTVAAESRGVLVLTGNGSEAAPFAFVWSPDHNAPLHADEFTDQIVHAAPLGGAARLDARLACGNAVDAHPLRYGDGTLDAGPSRQRNHRGANALRGCSFALAGVGVSSAVDFVPAAASRVRLFAVGDGVHRPFAAVAWQQAVETPVASVAPGAGMEGLWHDPATPGLGVSIAYAPDAPPDSRLQAVFYGVGSDGRATWNLIAAERGTTRGLSVYGFVTNPPGPTGLIGNASAPGSSRVQLTAAGTIEFHSCDTATLHLGNTSGSAFAAFIAPLDTIRLVKLLPGAGCTNPELG